MNSFYVLFLRNHTFLTFKQFMNVPDTLLQGYTLQDEKLEKIFNSLKSNKNQRFDDII